MDLSLQEILEDLSSVDMPSIIPNFNSILDDLRRFDIPTPESSPNSYDGMSSATSPREQQYVTLTPPQSPLEIYDAAAVIPGIEDVTIWQDSGNSSMGSYATTTTEEPYGQDVTHQPSIIEYFSSFAQEISSSCDVTQEPIYITWSVVLPVEEAPPVSATSQTQQLIEVPQNELQSKPQRTAHITYGTELYCKQCNKEFGRKGSLQQHIRRFHASERPFRCGTCGKRFVTEEQLAKHKLRHDPKNRQFPCPQCEKSYAHVKDRDRHFDAHHGTPAHQCKYCGKRFTRRDHLLAHEQAHEKQGLMELQRGRRRRKVPGGNGVLMPIDV
ncbi:zinc finger protein OBI1-like [Wyeomyia smithii]|uniref:zinc finger protein OBI1-like n=1 Tax=Wyeomyia smithii TaxID=174621 RepID=UPI002467B048|nr:zinc finger protein OBI1-like [Wyeomyia smithii]